MTLPRTQDIEAKRPHVLACLTEGKRLFIVYNQLLDADIQPSDEDFSVKIRGKNANLKSAHLQSPLQAGSSWSVITLLVDRALPISTEATVGYRPIQWLMSPLNPEASVEPFEVTTQLLDGKALAALATLDNGDEQESHKVVSGAKATITSASNKLVKIRLTRELDIYQKLDAGDFRAELSDRWLTITKTYFNPDEEAVAELWIELREKLDDGNQIKVSYKSPRKQLKTVDGTAIVSFTASGVTSADGAALAAAPRTPGPNSHRDLTELAQIYDTLSEADKKIAALMGFAPVNPTPESQPEPEPDPPQISAEAPQNPVPVAAAPQSPAPDDQNREDTEDQEDQEDQSRSVSGKYNVPIKKLAWIGGAAIAVWVLVTTLQIGTTAVDDGPDSPSTARERCTVDYPDGGRYEGECIDGRKDGQGSYVWASGVRYEGGWSNDAMHDKGVMHLKNGARMEGKWHRGESAGVATITWSNGTLYVGQAKNTQPHGIGKITYQNGDTYKGEFRHSLMDGDGTMIWASGAKYSGQYQNGKASGQGTYWSTDGSRFEGLFAEGKPTRKGTCYRSDGSSTLGRCAR